MSSNSLNSSNRLNSFTNDRKTGFLRVKILEYDPPPNLISSTNTPVSQQYYCAVKIKELIKLDQNNNNNDSTNNKFYLPSENENQSKKFIFIF